MQERFKVVLGVINIILQESNVLLLLRKNKFDAGKYSLPGGCVEQVETVKQNAVKEIKEETNLDVQEEDVEVVSTIYRNMPDWKAVELVTVLKKFQGKVQNMELDKCEKLQWFNINELPENMSGYALKAINNYKNKISFSEIEY